MSFELPTYPELKHKMAIITGGGSGIGFKQTELLLKQGCFCQVLDLKITSPLDDLNAHYPDQLTLWPCDLRDIAQLQAVTQQILQITMKIDFLLNTAGILDAYRPLLDTTQQQWDDLFKTNLNGQFYLTRAILPKMLKQGHGKILNMASIAGLVAGGGGAAYTAVKHAVIGFTKQLDYDYAAQGISANCLAPGAIDTPMNAADFEGTGQMAKTVAAQTPAKRWGHSEEVALTTLFMLSHGADFIHGVVLPIDGGWLEQ